MDNISYITDESGHKTAVVMPIANYEDMLEDISDLRIVAERKNETSISLDDLKKGLND